MSEMLIRCEAVRSKREYAHFLSWNSWNAVIYCKKQLSRCMQFMQKTIALKAVS